MKRVIVSVTNDLATDQRVHKVCSSLSKNNYEIILVGRKLRQSLPITRSYRIKRFKLLFNKGFLFYAEYNFRLFWWLFFSKKDILLSNDLDTLLANFLISKTQTKKLVYDSHELFSEVPELVHRPVVKKVWCYLENLLYPKLKNCYTVCDSIANIYKKKYNTHFKVVRNIPVNKDLSPLKKVFITEKKIILYQGSLNIGRGIELMIDTMPLLDDFIFIIAGSGDIDEELKKMVITKNLEDKVTFLGRIPLENLKEITVQASIGISFEEDLGLNYRYALPNKIFDYIQSEVPVLVSDLPEMKQLILNYQIGEFIKERNPENIAKQIINITNSDFKDRLASAKKELTWQNEEKILIPIFDNLD